MAATKKAVKNSPAKKTAAKRSQNKTQPTRVSVTSFLNSVENETRRKDAKTVLALMKKVTAAKPVMWGPTLIGFGTYKYSYESGREGEFMRVGFSPRKANLVLYIIPGFTRYDALMKKLGKFSTGKSCLYVNKLADVDLAVLERLVAESWAYMNEKYPT